MRAIDADALYDMISDNACHDIVSVADVFDFIKSAPPLDCTLGSAWISVKERPPETISNKVLVWVEGGFRPFMGHFVEGDSLFPDEWRNLEAEGECFTSPVTHWMELPEGPKEG